MRDFFVQMRKQIKKVAPTTNGAGRMATPALNGARATSQNLTALEIEISAKHYAAAEIKAKQRGCTVEEYITSLIVEDALFLTGGESHGKPAPAILRLGVWLGLEQMGVIRIPVEPAKRIRAIAERNGTSMVDALTNFVRFAIYPGGGCPSYWMPDDRDFDNRDEVVAAWPIPAIDSVADGDVGIQKGGK